MYRFQGSYFTLWALLFLTPEGAHQFQLGTSYLYEYETQLDIYQDVQRPTTHAIKGNLLLTKIWENPDDVSEHLIKLELSNLKLHVAPPKSPELSPHFSQMEKSKQRPLFVHVADENGVFKSPKDSPEEVNLKKGVASLLQLKYNSSRENDVAGSCFANYHSSGNARMSLQVTKEKTDCTRKLITDQRCDSLRCPTSVSQENVLYTLNKDQAIQSVRSVEQVRLEGKVTKDTSIGVKSSISLNLISEEDTGQQILASNFEEVKHALLAELEEPYQYEDLAAIVKTKRCDRTPKASTAIKNYKTTLKESSMATVKSASTFLKLLNSFRCSSKEEIVEVLKNKYNIHILAPLMDVLGAAQTEDSILAVLESFDFTSNPKQRDILERYLFSLSTTLIPQADAIRHILILAKSKIFDDKLQASVFLTLGSLANSFCISVDCRHEVIREVQDFLLQSLEGCKYEDCKQTRLLALVNAALPSTVEPLLRLIPQLPKSLTCLPLQAVKEVAHYHLLSSDCLGAVLQVYNQVPRPYDSTTRILAAEVLLLSPGTPISALQHLVESFKVADSPEVKTFLLGRLHQIKQQNENLRDVLDNSIFKVKDAKNYHSLSHGGSSMAFSNELMQSDYLNASYSVFIENTKGGLLKKSSFDVELSRGNQSLQLLSVGLFASGLASVAGVEDDEEDEGSIATGGMELAIFGKRLRPYTFFSGSGELMSLVWSGAGSEPTSALKGNLIFMDQSTPIVLSSGQVLDLDFKSALSIDLNGQIEISLWNRNSHSVVKAGAAVIVSGSLSVDTSYVYNSLEFQMSGDGHIDFITDLDFYNSPMRMCVQMDRPPLELKLTSKKTCKIPKSRYIKKSTGKKNIKLLGNSYPLNRKNAEMCSHLLS